MWLTGAEDVGIPATGHRVVSYLGPSTKPQDPDPVDNLQPQAFLVDLAHETDLRPHFHTVDQFQLFRRGAARFGHHEVTAHHLHYADRLQPYGPLVPGPSGVSFLNLRARSDTSAYYMPEAQEKLRELFRYVPERPGNRRSLTVDLTRGAGTDGSDWHHHVVDDDGLAIRTARLDSTRAHVDVPSPGMGGAFVVVLAGTVRHGDEIAEAGCVAYRPPGADAVRLEACPGGAHVAALQFPDRITPRPVR